MIVVLNEKVDYRLLVWKFVLHNIDDHPNGHVELSCTKSITTISRYDGWHLYSTSFLTKNYKTWIETAKSGHMLSRFTRLHEVSLTTYPGHTPMIASFPLYEVDEEMCRMVKEKIAAFTEVVAQQSAVIIQSAVRMSIAKKKYSIKRLRLFNELYSLPKGYVVDWFPGGIGYREAMERFVGSTNKN